MLASLALTVVVVTAAAPQEPAPPVDDPAPADDPAAEPAAEGAAESAAQPVDADSLVDDLFAGRWLDPVDAYWKPRRGERFELSLFLGGEGAFEGMSLSQPLPTIGGMTLTGLGRYYPVDRLAVVFGGRTYIGLDGIPATGTTASSVISLITGVRYDLVRENRFSLMWDLFSGPSIYVFADLPSVAATAVAVGGEMGSGLALRYSIGPFTGEARGVVGARAGASANPFQRTGDAGPFSSVYAGIDLGATWSLQ